MNLKEHRFRPWMISWWRLLQSHCEINRNVPRPRRHLWIGWEGKVVHLLPNSAETLKDRVCVCACACAGLRPSERVSGKYAWGNSAGHLPADVMWSLDIQWLVSYKLDSLKLYISLYFQLIFCSFSIDSFSLFTERDIYSPSLFLTILLPRATITAC